MWRNRMSAVVVILFAMRIFQSAAQSWCNPLNLLQHRRREQYWLWYFREYLLPPILSTRNITVSSRPRKYHLQLCHRTRTLFHISYNIPGCTLNYLNEIIVRILRRRENKWKNLKNKLISTKNNRFGWSRRRNRRFESERAMMMMMSALLQSTCWWGHPPSFRHLLKLRRFLCVSPTKLETEISTVVGCWFVWRAKILVYSLNLPACDVCSEASSVLHSEQNLVEANPVLHSKRNCVEVYFGHQFQWSINAQTKYCFLLFWNRPRNPIAQGLFLRLEFNSSFMCFHNFVDVSKMTCACNSRHCVLLVNESSTWFRLLEPL